MIDTDEENFAQFYLDFCGISFFEKSFLDNEWGRNALLERALLLYTFAKIARAQVIVETGTANGFSAVCLAKAMRDNKIKDGILHTVDCYSWSKDFSQRARALETIKLNQLESNIVAHEGHSIEVLSRVLCELPAKIDLIHIDSEHDFETPKREFELVEPYLNEGAYLFFHDTDINAVKEAVEGILATRKMQYEKITVPLHSEMTILRRLGN